jgi:hypothetical protein
MSRRREEQCERWPYQRSVADGELDVGRSQSEALEALSAT